MKEYPNERTVSHSLSNFVDVELTAERLQLRSNVRSCWTCNCCSIHHWHANTSSLRIKSL